MIRKEIHTRSDWAANEVKLWNQTLEQALKSGSLAGYRTRRAIQKLNQALRIYDHYVAEFGKAVRAMRGECPVKAARSWTLESLKVKLDKALEEETEGSLARWLKSQRKLHITLREYSNECADGCCLDYGMEVRVNGEELESNNLDTGTILQKVLEHLGYDAVVEDIF
jgi:hypothetical protein